MWRGGWALGVWRPGQLFAGPRPAPWVHAQDVTTGPGEAEAGTLAHAASEWMLVSARRSGDALTWAGSPGAHEVDPTLSSGGAAVVLVLLEAHAHFGDARYADAAMRGGRGVADAVDNWEHSSLYFGLTGMALALHALGTHYDDESFRQSARRALNHVQNRFDGERWSAQIELLGHPVPPSGRDHARWRDVEGKGGPREPLPPHLTRHPGDRAGVGVDQTRGRAQ